jgi:septum formation protein
VCIAGQNILGQPRDPDHARRMLGALRNAEHRTITGVCLIALRTDDRIMFFDQTIVRIGTVADAQIEAYIESGDWRGKAGAYNLSERIAAGWPIEVEGDPATVMGLPMRRLTTMLGRG